MGKREGSLTHSLHLQRDVVRFKKKSLFLDRTGWGGGKTFFFSTSLPWRVLERATGIGPTFFLLLLFVHTHEARKKWEKEGGVICSSSSSSSPFSTFLHGRRPPASFVRARRRDIFAMFALSGLIVLSPPPHPPPSPAKLFFSRRTSEK